MENQYLTSWYYKSVKKDVLFNKWHRDNVAIHME